MAKLYHDEQSRRGVFPGIFSVMTRSPTYSLQARYLFPIDRPPIPRGWITVSEGRIVGVGQEPAGDRRDLGDVAILPAFINAHTHLEFSNLEQPLGERGMPFTEWIREVIRWRRAAIEESEGTDWRRDPIRKGLEDCLRGGAVSLGEIATLPQAESDGRYDAMQGVGFLELLGLADERHDELLAAARAYLAAWQGVGWPPGPTMKQDAAARAHLATWRGSGPRQSAGLSPHAPYTVGPKLVGSIATLAASTRAPVAMHLAETREELELLRSGGGPFRELLDDLGAWHAEVIPHDSTPLDYLKLLAKADRSLVIHGNYLNREEIAFAGQHNERMSVVYCPRTHAYFDHARYPLREMWDCGVNIALGTDSRASNPDLNMLHEVRFVAQQHQDVSLEKILRLATINAAKALGMAEMYGTLAPGKQADLIVIPISRNKHTDPHALLFESSHGLEQVFRKGKGIFPFNSVQDAHL